MKRIGLHLLLVIILLFLTSESFFTQTSRSTEHITSNNYVTPFDHFNHKAGWNEVNSPAIYTDVFISEYIEGSGNNKYLEIANYTDADITANFQLQIYLDGSPSYYATLSFNSHTFYKNTVYVIANNSATIYTGHIDKSTSSSVMKFDGNDIIVLNKNGTLIDAIGRIGENPGTEWGSGDTSTADNTLRRKHNILHGDGNGNDPFYPSAEWFGYPMNDVSDLGNFSPLPVELYSFTASARENDILLKWSTSCELNNYGFEIERASNSLLNGEWTKIGFVRGCGNSNVPNLYSFIDKNVSPGNYNYRLKQLDNDGAYKYSDIVYVTIEKQLQFELKQNYPNPFNPVTTISYSIPKSSYVTLKVYSFIGQEVRTLVKGYNEAGSHTINFNAENLTSGLYIYKLTAGDYSQGRKMTLLK